nr:hypothetical protein GCM10020092_063000 [Actinoplanes digitatis]
MSETTRFDQRIPGSRSATDPDRLLPRGRHDLPREFVSRTQRDRLIDAMARTVAELGYANASLGDVCAAAGVSTRAFYEHFVDKEACFLAAFDLGVSLLQRAVAEAYARPARWPQRMHHGLDTLVRILAAEPAFASLAVVEVLAAGPRARACHAAAAGRLQGVLHRGAAPGRNAAGAAGGDRRRHRGGCTASSTTSCRRAGRPSCPSSC